MHSWPTTGENATLSDLGARDIEMDQGKVESQVLCTGLVSDMGWPWGVERYIQTMQWPLALQQICAHGEGDTHSRTQFRDHVEHKI